MRSLFIAVLATLTFIVTPAFGATPAPKSMAAVQSVKLALLSAAAINVACDASIDQVEAPACAYFELDMRGYSTATIIIEYTFSTATAIQIWQDASSNADAVCTRSANCTGAVPWGISQSQDGSVAPTITLGDIRYVHLVSASTSIEVTFTNLNSPFYRWRIVGAGAASGDTVNVDLVRRGR